MLAGAAAAAVLSFDPNSQKQRIVDAVTRATGRQLTLAGPLHIRWGVSPALELEDASFANMPGGSRPAMATVAKMVAQVELLPLLSHRVEISSVTLIHPDILLETDASGRGNWRFDRPQPAAAGPASVSGGSRTTTVLDRVTVENGVVTWHDGVTGQTAMAKLPHATLDLGAGAAHLAAAAEVAGTAVTVDAALGDWAQMTGAAPGPFPVKASAELGGAKVTLDGMADPAGRRLTGRVQASIPDLAQFGALLQRPGLPPLHAVEISATLPGGGAMPTDIALKAGASDLGSVLQGASLTQLNATWPAGQAARIDANGALNGREWRVGTAATLVGQGVALRGLAVTSPVGDVSGDVDIAWQPLPTIRGALASNRLDLDALRGLRQPVASATSPAPAASSPAQPAASARVFSDAKLPFPLLQRAAADLQLTIGTLHWGGADYTSAAGHIALQGGVLRIDPASVQSPAGHVDFSASADSRPPAPAVVLNLRSGDAALNPLLQAFGLPGGSDGTAELDVALHAAGQTPHELAATLGGHAGLAVVDADVANAVLALAAGDLLRSTGAKLDPNGRSHVRCLAIRADAKDGQVTLATLKLDSSRLELTGSGTLNLADETMALHLHPLLRLGGAGVAAPVRLEGSLRRPSVALDSLGEPGRVGVVIGGLAGAPDSCAAELAAARDGRVGRLPAEARAEKAASPADLLRSLLR